MAASAVRRPSSRYQGAMVIDVTVPEHDFTKTVGGARAVRATAIVVSKWPRRTRVNVACRADSAAAEKEASRLVTATEIHMRSRFGPGPTVPVEPAEWAIVIPVTEAES